MLFRSVPSFTANPLSTTNYFVTGTDVNGCKDTSEVVVTVNSLPNVNGSSDVSICYGDSTIVSANGAISYVWSSGQTVPLFTANPLSTTNYFVTGTDVNGCKDTSEVVVTVNSLPDVNGSSDVSICYGDSTQLSVNGALTYIWSPITGLSDPNIWNPIANPSSTTTYTVIGTIAGCSNSASVIVTVNPLPTAVVSNDTTICAGTSITLTASGGNTYLWSTGQTSASISVSPSATTSYSVTITSLNCSDTGSVVVNVNALPIIVASGDMTICSGNSASLNASGAMTYSWSPVTGLSDPNIANPTASPTSTTVYTVTGTSFNCSSTATATVIINALPSVTISSSADSVCANQNVSLTGHPANGTFTGNGVMGNLFSSAIAGASTVTYTYTNVNGCTDSASKMIYVFDAPRVDSLVYDSESRTIIFFGNFPIPIEIIVEGDITYSAGMQNASQAIFNDVLIEDGNLLVVQYTSLGGCFSYQFFVGIGEGIKGEDFVKIYPNPFNDILNINLPRGDYEVFLIDMLGRTVRNMSVKEDFKIQRDGLVEGLYLLQIVSKGNLVFTGKVKVQN